MSERKKVLEHDHFLHKNMMTSTPQKIPQTNSTSTKEHLLLLRSQLSSILSSDSLERIPDLLAQSFQENCACNQCTTGRNWINRKSMRIEKIPERALLGSHYQDDKETEREMMMNDRKFSGKTRNIADSGGMVGHHRRIFDNPSNKKTSSELKTRDVDSAKRGGYERTEIKEKLGRRDSGKKEPLEVNVSDLSLAASRKKELLHTLDYRTERRESSESDQSNSTPMNSEPAERGKRRGSKRNNVDNRPGRRDYLNLKIEDSPQVKPREVVNLEHVSKLKEFTDKLFPQFPQFPQSISRDKMADKGHRLCNQLSPETGAQNGAEIKVPDRTDHVTRGEVSIGKRKIGDLRNDNYRFAGECGIQRKRFADSKTGKLEMDDGPMKRCMYAEHLSNEKIPKIFQNTSLAKLNPPSIISNNSFQPIISPDLLTYFMTKQKAITSLPVNFMASETDPFCTANRAFDSFAETGKIPDHLPSSAMSFFGQSHFSSLAKTNYILQDFQLKYRDMLRRLTENQAFLTSLYTNDIINIQNSEGEIPPGDFLKNRTMYTVNGSTVESPSWRFPSYLDIHKTSHLPTNFTPLHPVHPPTIIPNLKNDFSPPLAHSVGFFPSKGETGKVHGPGKPKTKTRNPEKPADIIANHGKEKKSHRCLYCGKLYSRKYGLKIHIRTHTGYKPLKCKVCGRPFGDPSNLNKHVRLHAEGDTPYRCDFCGKVLVRRRDLERHIKSRHPGSTTQHRTIHHNMTWRNVQNINAV